MREKAKEEKGREGKMGRRVITSRSCGGKKGVRKKAGPAMGLRLTVDL